MRTQASAGRHKFLSSTFCNKLTMTVDPKQTEDRRKLEAEFLGRLAQEIQDGQMGTLLAHMRNWQDKIPMPKNGTKLKPL